MSDLNIEIKKYQLLQFIDEQKAEAASLNIDRVPRRWVRYNVDIGHVVVKFPPPPYTLQKFKLLESLIKTEGEPLLSWPEYPVKLIGHADTYTDAVDRLVVLESKSYAYTSDSEVSSEKKAAQITKQLKKESLRAIMEVPTMEDEDSAESNASIDDEYDSQSSSDETQTSSLPIKIKKGQGGGKAKKNIQPKKVVKSRASNSGSSKFTVNNKCAKVGGQVLKKVQPKAAAKPHGNLGSSKFKATANTVVDTDRPPNSVQEFGNLEPNSNGIEGAKVGNEIQEKVQAKDVTKPCGNPGSSKFKAAIDTNVDSEEAFLSVPEFENLELDQNGIEGAKVWGKVQKKLQPKDIAKPRGNSGSLTSDYFDIEGDYFVLESGELELDGNTIENSQGNDQMNSFSKPAEIPTKNKKEIGCLRKYSSFEASLKTATETLQKADKEYSKDTLLIMTTLTGLRVDLQNNTKAIEKLCAAIQDPKQFVHGKVTPSALVLENEFNLPFETLEQFKDFDVQLREDTKYRQHCAATLLFYIDPENHVNKSVTNIMKKFVGRDVAMLFTAKKQTANKEVFKNMKFCDVMLEVLAQQHTDSHGKPVCEKYIFQCIGQALANAKDWDGFRVKRAEKEMEKKRLAVQGMAEKKAPDV